MNAAEAVARLQRLAVPAVRVSEAAAVLRMSAGAASAMLQRLGTSGLVRPVRKGIYWIAADPPDPALLLEYLTAPYPAYTSLYTALYVHGVLSQVPAMHYAVSLSRTQSMRTRVVTFSVHHIAPALFDGFEVLPSGAKLASVEKALFDLAWLAPARSGIFHRPPELELPRLRKKTIATRIDNWIDRVTDPKRRAMVRAQIEKFLSR